MTVAIAPPRAAAGAALTLWKDVLVLLFRREGSNLYAVLANSVMLPAFVCYAAFMLTPVDSGAREVWALGGLVLALGTTSLSQIYYGVATDRLLGGYRLLSAQGVSRNIYAAVYLTYAVVLALLVGVAGAAFLRFAGLVSVGWEAVPTLLLLVLISGATLGAIGMCIGLSVKSFGMGDIIVNVSGMLLAVVSPVFYPATALPGIARPLAALSPYTHIAAVASALAAGRPAPESALWALSLLAIIALVLAGRQLRRLQS